MTRVNASGPKNAKLAIVGIAPASEEVATGIPFMGPAGRILNDALAALGISRKEVYVTNILNFPIKVGIPIEAQCTRELLHEGLARLKTELLEVNPNVTMPLGAEALEYICGKHGIMKWRGSILESTLIPGKKCVVSVHPSWIQRGMWKWRPVFTFIDLKRAITESKFPEIHLPKRTALTGPSFSTVLDYIETCRKATIASFDIETAYWSKDQTGEVACFGLAHKPDEGLCVPLIRLDGRSFWSEIEEARIWRALAGLLQDINVKVIGQNLSFDYTYMWLHHIFPRRPYIDTMLLHHCIYPDWGQTEDFVKKQTFDEPGHGLAFINSQYTGTPYYKDDGKRWNPEFGEHGLWRYNCLDVMCTLEAAMKMEDEALDEKQWDFFQRMYMRPFMHALRMEWFGTPIDVQRRTLARREAAERSEELQKEINKMMGCEFNVNSPKQMAELLYSNRGYQPKYKHDKKTGKSKITTDRAAVEFFAMKNEDRVLNLIIELKKLKDLISDVLESPLDSNGYTHTHYKLGGTDSGRWSSARSILGSGSNLQNIPRRGIARSLFVAR